MDEYAQTFEFRNAVLMDVYKRLEERLCFKCEFMCTRNRNSRLFPYIISRDPWFYIYAAPEALTIYYSNYCERREFSYGDPDLMQRIMGNVIRQDPAKLGGL